MAKEAKGFGEILSDSWKEYKGNWKVYSGMILLLSFIPALIVFLIQALFMRDILSYIISNTPSLSIILTPKYILLTVSSIRYI